jgi:hypothetical protein
MEEGTGIATVTKVLKQPVIRLAAGLEVSGFTVRAKMYAPAHRYSDDLFYVKVTNPVALASRQPEQGTLMAYGEFELDAAKEVKIGDRLEISIFPAISNF